MKQNKDRDFLNAALVAKVPVELFFSLIASSIVIFSIYVSMRLEGQNQVYTVDEVIFYMLPVLTTTIICIPFIISPISTILSLMTVRTDIDVWESAKLTARLQWSMLRQPGANVGAQGRLAKLSNLRRLASFVWVKKASNEIVVGFRQDLRQDVNSQVDDLAMRGIATDIAEITDKTYTSLKDLTVNDRFIFDHFKRFKVAKLN